MSWKEKIKSGSLIAIISLFSASSFSQHSYELLHRDIQFLYEPLLAADSNHFHTNVRPFFTPELKKVMDVDSIKNAAALIRYGNKDGSPPSNLFGIDMLFNFVPGAELSDTLNQATINSGIGFGLHGGYKKFYANINYTTENGAYPTYVTKNIKQTNVVPSQGYAFGTKAGYHHKNFNGYLSYSASDYFNFQLGHGKNFFGDGYRSLLLSDVANNYSYLKITTTIWKLKYVNLFTNLKDVNSGDGRYRNFPNKYATMHYLSFNTTKWLNLSLFESVVWQGKDTLNNRGFDVNYLNPIIFYRPIEYSLGSSDNSLIGASFRIKAGKSIQLYGQLILDEFLLSEIKAGNGWWANKHGAQAGFKWFNFLTVKGLHLQGELNMVRPYTYSHTSPLQSFGHFNQSMAHPTGGNFREAVGFIRYQKKRMNTEAQLVFNKFGTNTGGENYGQNIFISNSNRPSEFGHFIGQGNTTNLVIAQLKYGYRLSIRSNTTAEIGLRHYRSSSLTNTHSSNFLWVGVKTALFNNYYDY